MQEYRARQPAFDLLAARIKYLHERLHITPAQEPLWANLAQVMRENAKSVAPLLKERFQTAKSGNAINSLSTYEKLGEAQLDGLKKFTAAFQALYVSLTDYQKKIADSVFRLPQFPEQLVTPSPYAYYPSYSTPPAYPLFPALFLLSLLQFFVFGSPYCAAAVILLSPPSRILLPPPSGLSPIPSA